MNTGLHILADFYYCENKNVLTYHGIYLQHLLSRIRLYNMNAFDYMIKYFGKENDSGYTLIIGLEESHISIHTFPLENELEKCSIDLYTCSISQDNGEACRKLYKFLIEIFQPKEVRNEHLIERI